MADGIVIWSNKPVDQKNILLDMVEAAYESNLPFNCEGSKTYEYNGIKKIYPDQFTIKKNKYEWRTSMIFHICNYEEQKFGIGKWENVRLISSDGDNIIFPELYRIAVSEDSDNEMTFNFSYHYLKLNKAHIISISDYIVDWNLINAVYKYGFNENWYPLDNQGNKE